MTTITLDRLLRVDNEIGLMTALCEMLVDQGYEAVGFTSAEEALEALKKQDFDLLLTDLTMPDKDGIALLKAALEIDPHLVGIILTASIGIALSATGYDRPEELLWDADTAMYRAKALGKARYEMFDRFLAWSLFSKGLHTNYTNLPRSSNCGADNNRNKQKNHTGKNRCCDVSLLDLKNKIYFLIDFSINIS